MQLEILTKSGKYNEVIEYAASHLDNLSKRERKFLKRVLLFCGVDFICTYKNEKYDNNMNNPYFLKNDKLNTIKIILDSDIDIFYYLYLNINDQDYIESELKKYKDYFSDIIFDQKKMFYNEKKLKNDLQKDGIIQVKNFFHYDEIEKIKMIVLDYMKNTELSKYFFNENRQRVYIKKKDKSDVLSMFHNLLHTKKIEDFLKEQIDIDVVCDYIQLEWMQKTPVQTDKIKHWHLDNLSDQFKVFIPLVDVDEYNAPMNYILGTHVLQNLNDEMKNYIHYIFRMSGVITTPTTGLPNYLVDNLSTKQLKGTIKQGDIAVFNSALVHTGSFVRNEKYRLNIVLVFDNILTNRNILFKQFKAFY